MLGHLIYSRQVGFMPDPVYFNQALIPLKRLLVDWGAVVGISEAPVVDVATVSFYSQYLRWAEGPTRQLNERNRVLKQ